MQLEPICFRAPWRFSAVRLRRAEFLAGFFGPPGGGGGGAGRVHARSHPTKKNTQKRRGGGAGEGGGGVASGLSFSLVWSTLEIARTFAAHHRRRKAPREIRRGEAAPLKTAKEPGNKSARTAF